MNITEKLFARFLGTYYLTTALTAGIIDEECAGNIYNTLAKAYLIFDEEKLGKFYELSTAEPYAEMDTLAEYERTCRMLEYYKARGMEPEITPEDRIILSAKREALIVAKTLLPTVENKTPDSLLEALLIGVSGGDVDAMTILAFLDMTGYVFGTNTRRAEINLNRAANWNSLDANLILASLFPESRQRALARIAASDKGSIGEDLCKYIKDSYEIEYVPYDDNAGLLDRAFALGVVERNKHDLKFSSIIHSSILSRQDKKYILATYNKETMHMYYDLPTDISTDLELRKNIEALEQMQLNRPRELRRVQRNLVGTAARTNALYRPPLFVCRDSFVLDEYKRALCEVFDTSAIVKLDAAHMTGAELSASKENVFLRGIARSNRISTVFFIDSVHKLSGAYALELSKFMRGDIRANFRLSSPQIGFDLSGILPILFSLGEPDESLAEYCDVIRLEPVAPEERRLMIESTVKYLTEVYRLKPVELDEELVSVLCTKSSEQIIDAVDELVKYAACEGDGVGVINKETYEKIMGDVRRSTVKFGF